MITVFVVDESNKTHTEFKGIEHYTQKQINDIILKSINTYVEAYWEERREQTFEKVRGDSGQTEDSPSAARADFDPRSGRRESRFFDSREHESR